MKHHRRFATLFATASLTALLWHAPAGASTPGDYQPPTLRKAESALRNGHPDRALALLQGREVEMRRWGAQAAASDVMCRAWFEKGDYARAERACDAAVAASDANEPDYVYQRGVMRLLLGRVEEGIADLRLGGGNLQANGAAPPVLHVAQR